MSKSANGSNNSNWKGGKHYSSDGYILIYSPDHPYRTKQNRIPEHRLVMEEHLGRYLTEDEQVHHKNRIRDDNRIENLELWTGIHPKGVRVKDLLKWCRETLAFYETEEELL